MAVRANTAFIKRTTSAANRLRELGRKNLGLLDADEAEAVHIAMAGMRSVPAGDELVAKGAPLGEPSLLLDGWAVRQRVLPDGRRQIFSFIVPGEAIGLSGWDSMRAPSSVVALTDVCTLPLPVLRRAMETRRGELFHWGRGMLIEEEASMHDQVMRLGCQTAYQRVAHQLLDLYYRLHHVGQMGGDGGFALPFSQEVLSDALGLSTVHINRTLQLMRRDKLLESRGHYMWLLNMAELIKVSDYEPLERVKTWTTR